jgi:hypothetical protein
MYNKVILYTAILSTTLFACSKSKTEPELAPITAVSQGLPVKRITHTFPLTEYHAYNNWIFNYTNNRLIGGASQMVYTDDKGQFFSDPTVSFNITRLASSISGTVDGQAFTGTLNSSGYLISLSMQDEDFTISYTSDGYLRKISQPYNWFGGPSTTDFTYSDGNLNIVQITDANFNNTLDTTKVTFQYGVTTNKSGVWPIMLDNVNMFSIFYYAALLGKPTKNLAVSATSYQSWNKLRENETYTHTYSDGYIATTSINSISSVYGGSNRNRSDLVTYSYN